MFGLSLLFLIICFSLFGPLFCEHNYAEVNLSLINEPPSHKFWFGTDDLGRDIFTRVCWGTKISLIVGFSAAIIDLLIGVTYGTIAALIGGKIDELMMRFGDILYTIPHLLTVILLMLVLGPGLSTIILALALTGWINMARVVRGQMLDLKENDYITAAKALGLPQRLIIFRHLIPNAFGIIIATITLTIPNAIFIEAFLSFLGLGLQPPMASLGVMISDALGAMRFYPWRLFFPAGVLTLTMFSFNLVGDALRDALDVRTVEA